MSTGRLLAVRHNADGTMDMQFLEDDRIWWALDCQPTRMTATHDSQIEVTETVIDVKTVIDVEILE